MIRKNILFGLNGFESLIGSKDYIIKKILIENNSPASRYLEQNKIDNEIKKKLIFLNRKDFSNFSKNNRTQGLIAHFEGKLTKTLPSFKNIKTKCFYVVTINIIFQNKMQLPFHIFSFSEKSIYKTSKNNQNNRQQHIEQLPKSLFILHLFIIQQTHFHIF